MHGRWGRGMHGRQGGVHGCWGRVVAGVCMVAGGHAWLPGGVHGCQGCMVARGHAWLLDGGHACPGGMHVWGHAWLLGGACVGYDEIQSMSGRYVSYWNAFLFCHKF